MERQHSSGLSGTSMRIMKGAFGAPVVLMLLSNDHYNRIAIGHHLSEVVLIAELANKDSS